MRMLLLAAIMAASYAAQAQRVDWHRVDLNFNHLDPTLAPANLKPATEAAIRRMILRTLPDHDCDPGDFTYSVAPLGRPGIVYVSPGAGCLRGGQGANASLWLVDTAARPLTIIGTPEGWGLGIQPTVSHGLHDFVIGWHMSASDTGLTYFRFDGRKYRKISSEDLHTCEKDPGSEPDPGFCLSDGKPARQTGSY